ncbi:tubulin polyglutamylase TTLL11 isoform X2 [Caretta caretta]|uniref:tubulin polyglutamylase TTLL11 isoform X2 n=1 Tax=Caretta caretta TaxID=8467 RepID=UPI002095158F|nr:tubulin polyglutamylase TTLL11 isoform X2 [Caretta caretta]
MEPPGIEPESCSPAQEPPGSPAPPAEEPEPSEAAPAPQQEAEGVPPLAPVAQGSRPGGPGSKGQAKRCGAGKGSRGKRGSTRRAGEEGGRPARRAHVTVDSSKAKTSLEALKISLRQLRWKEVRMMKESDPPWKPTFIVKPDGGCQGDGIYLIKDPSDIRLAGNLQSRPVVVQEYISKPLLIDKLKFDIRLYVLLKSLEPLEIYIAKDGLSRFCTEPYREPTLKNLHQVFMHLTNYSLNIHSGNFIHSDNVNTGSKRTFSSVLYRLSSKGVDIKKLWSDIISLVIKTVLALTPELKVYYQSDIPAGKPGPTCFQILGFDILLMKNLKPVLLEVNANPSMRIEHEQELSPGVFENVPSPVDEEIKVAVIRDTLRLMDPHKKKRKDNQSQLSENSSDTKDDLLEPGSTDQLEHDISKNPEASLPSLCLKQVFPKYAKQFNYLRLVDRMAALFIRFLGVKGTMKLGPTGFRTFIRNCKLSNSSFSMASVDILYIDITRRWNSMGLDQRESGMCLQAFVEAFFCLAQRRYKSLPLHEQVASLIDFCEYHLAILDEKRLVCSRGITERRAALVTCQPDGLHLTPATHAPLLNRMTAANKLTDYRNYRS